MDLRQAIRNPVAKVAVQIASSCDTGAAGRFARCSDLEVCDAHGKAEALPHRLRARLRVLPTIGSKPPGAGSRLPGADQAPARAKVKHVTAEALPPSAW